MFIRHCFIAAALLVFADHALTAKPIIVSQDKSGDFQGADDAPIQAAIDKAIKQGGGDILIRAGTYAIARGLVIKDGLHIALRGEDRETVILKLATPMSADVLNLINLNGKCEDVLIAKLTLEGGRSAAESAARGSAQSCGVLVVGDYDREKGRTGPALKQIGITDCSFQNFTGRGVAFYSVEEAAVERCAFMHTSEGAIDLHHFTTKCLVRGNRITRCGSGVTLMDATDCMVLGNEVSACVTGIVLRREFKQEDLGKRNFIRDNMFSACEQDGIEIAARTGETTVEDNEITGAGRNGISVSGAGQMLRNNAIRGAKLKAIAVNEGEPKLENNKTE